MIGINAPRRVDKPWGYELILAHTERYVGKILHIEPGQRLSRQFHRVKDETIYVLEGRLHLEIGPANKIERIIVQKGNAFRLVPGTIHRFIAPDEGACVIIETSTPELDDVVRLEDIYGRQGTDKP
jgi:mannose-6-phosphate isomerase-like protein (cupin superfamily)